METRRCYAFDQTTCLHNAQQWPDLQSFAAIESERCIKGKTTREQRLYTSRLSAAHGAP